MSDSFSFADLENFTVTSHIHDILEHNVLK
jgi:hypothetical protein